MEKIVQNERIYLRKLTSNDAIHFLELNNDPLVIQFTGDIPFKDLNSAELFLKNYPNYDRDGYGRWAVCDRKTDLFLGWCGLNKSQNDGSIDVGFRFFKEHWGKGLASMATRLCIDYGFNVLNLDQIVARVYVKNKASIRVLQKSGLQFIKEINYDGNKALFYTIHPLVIQKITAVETHALRLEILRVDIPLPFTFESDEDSSTFHLGTYSGVELVGVSSFMKSDANLFKEPQYQLRGMATKTSHQGRGVGKKMLQEAEEKILKLGVSILWCNAREEAVLFYKKQGFKIIGIPFEIKYIGTHFTMFKSLLYDKI